MIWCLCFNWRCGTSCCAAFMSATFHISSPSFAVLQFLSQFERHFDVNRNCSSSMLSLLLTVLLSFLLLLLLLLLVLLCCCCCCFDCCYWNKEGNRPSFPTRKFALSATATPSVYFPVPAPLPLSTSLSPSLVFMLLWCQATCANTKWQTTHVCVYKWAYVCLYVYIRDTHTH